MSFWIDILSTIVSPILEKHLATLRESREIKKFNKILIDLSEEYIREHETEAVAHSEFDDYLKRSNIFENMFDFIENPNNISEKEFIAEKSDAANKYVNEYHPIDITDKSVYGYIYIIFQSIKKLPSLQNGSFYGSKFSSLNKGNCLLNFTNREEQLLIFRKIRPKALNS